MGVSLRGCFLCNSLSQSLRQYPLSHGLRRARFPLLSPTVTSSPGAGEVCPQGGTLGTAEKFAATAKSRPLGEAGLTRSGKTEGVRSGWRARPLRHRLRRCHLSQRERPWQSTPASSFGMALPFAKKHFQMKLLYLQTLRCNRELFHYAKGSPFGRAVTEGD